MMVAVAVAGRAAARPGAAEESKFHFCRSVSTEALPRQSDRANISARPIGVEASVWFMGADSPVNAADLQARALGVSG
jgi:hypothetical protein